jgi:hypothetical protein
MLASATQVDLTILSASLVPGYNPVSLVGCGRKQLEYGDPSPLLIQVLR